MDAPAPITARAATGVLDLTAEADAPSGLDRPGGAFIDTVLLDAIRRDASDLHLEWFPAGVRIRYRIDGVLRLPGVESSLLRPERACVGTEERSN